MVFSFVNYKATLVKLLFDGLKNYRYSSYER